MLVEFTFKSAQGRIVKLHKLDVKSSQATPANAPELAGKAFDAARLHHLQREQVDAVEVRGIGEKPLVFKKDSFLAPLL